VDDILGPPKRSQSKAKTASKSGSGGSKSLDSLIDDIVGGPSKATKKRKTKAKATKSTASLPAGPSRGDVVKAMKRVAGRAKRCGSGKKGTAMVKLVVAGSTGRVKNAQVTNSPFRGTKEGSCIAREVRKARLPKFKKASMTITYPFKI